MVRFLACAGASSQARGNSQRAHPRRARRSPARGPSVRCMQLQKSFGRASGSRCRPALSVGRRRDLAFGSLAPPSHRSKKVGGKKGSEKGSRAKACGVADRERASKGHSSEIATAGRRWWFLLAPATRHEAEELRGEKRHLTMEGVLVCLYAHLLHGRWAEADSATRPGSHELRQGA
jgi:hypothetical protein